MPEELKPKHMQAHVNVGDLPILECNCGCIAMVPIFQVHFMSALIGGQARLVQVPLGYVCSACGVDNDFTNIVMVTGVGGITPSSKYQKEEEQADDYDSKADTTT